MSRTGRRKHMLREVKDDDLSGPKENQSIVRIIANCGHYLSQVVAADGSTFMVTLPVKFRKTFWVKPKMFVLIDHIEEGSKVKGEVVKILTEEHISAYKSDNVWPSGFDDGKTGVERVVDDDGLYMNTNTKKTKSISARRLKEEYEEVVEDSNDLEASDEDLGSDEDLSSDDNYCALSSECVA